MDKFPFIKQTKKITKEEFQAELISLLKEFPYPYPQTRKSKTTMFERLRSKRLLSVLISESVISEIKCALEIFEIEQSAMAFGDKKRRDGSTQFHRSMIEAMDLHFAQVLVLLKKYKIDDDWIAEYLSAAKAQMDKDFRALRPLSFPIQLAPQAKAWNDMVCSVYDILTTELSKAGTTWGHKELAFQLTSIICSPSALFSPGSGISPQAVRKIIERRDKLGQKTS
jgi:hypothetical protein